MKLLIILLHLQMQNDTTSAMLLMRRCKVCQPVIITAKVVTDKNCNVVAYLSKKNKVIDKKFVLDYSLIQ
jgi:hypothetical protein